MGQRDAPATPHPAPAPDWILGSAGRWHPPPIIDGGTRRSLDRTVVVRDDAPSTPHKVGAGVIFAVILVILAVSYLAWVALVA